MILPQPLQATFVYGTPCSCKKPLLWDYIKEIGAAYDGPLLLIGDFNDITPQQEKQWGSPFCSPSSGGLQGLVNDIVLLILVFQGTLSLGSISKLMGLISKLGLTKG